MLKKAKSRKKNRKHWVVRQAERETKKLEAWIIRNYGKRCPDYCEGCIVCEAWKFYDAVKMIDRRN